MVSSPSSGNQRGSSPSLAELTAEAHRLYALLCPQGQVQVILPPGEQQRMQGRYQEVCAQLTAAQTAQQGQRAATEKWMEEASEALPEMLSMLPHEWRERLGPLVEMEPGPTRDKLLRAALNDVVNGGALARLGPVGIAAGPMIRKFLRKGKL